MRNETDWELFIDYLERNHNPEDEMKLNEGERSDEINQQTLKKIQRIWNTPNLQLPKPDMEKAWQRFEQGTGVGKENIQQNLQLRTMEKRTPFFRQLWSYKLLRIAAVVLIIITIPYIAAKFTKPAPLVEIVVPTAQKMIFTLSDGSKVTLDAETVFRYPESFDSHQREVYLNGEGYFEVISYSDIPFVVHANNAIITVLGTKFNVRSWKNSHQDKVTVAVVEGRVSLRPENVDHQDANVIISVGQSSELIENRYPSTPQFLDINKSISWLEREMYFQKIPLREVLDQLERWYGCEISLPDSSLSSSRVTVYIENKPIEENLEIISLMNNFQFRKEGKHFIFSKIN